MNPPALKLGPWDIWTGGERPPDQPTGGMSTGSSYRWIRWEGGPWIQSDMPTHRLLRALSYLSPWLYDEPQRDDCPDCGGEWNKMEHEPDCPRGRAFRLMDNAEPEIREQAKVLLDLPEGWDSYSAKTIDPKSAQLAVRVAQALYAIADFRMVPMPSGGVALEAHDGGQDVEIEIEAAGVGEPVAVGWSAVKRAPQGLEIGGLVGDFPELGIPTAPAVACQIAELRRARRVVDLDQVFAIVGAAEDLSREAFDNAQRAARPEIDQGYLDGLWQQWCRGGLLWLGARTLIAEREAVWRALLNAAAPAGAEPGVPWWEPRPWGEDGPPVGLVEAMALNAHQGRWRPISRDGNRWVWLHGGWPVNAGKMSAASHWTPMPPTPRKEQP